MKGFIERIEEENVYVVFEDDSRKVFHISEFSSPITLDMQIEELNGQLKVYPSDKKIKQEIDELTNKIFVSFKDKKKNR